MKFFFLQLFEGFDRFSGLGRNIASGCYDERWFFNAVRSAMMGLTSLASGIFTCLLM